MHLLDIAQNSIRAGARTVHLTAVEDPAGDTLTLEVADDGCGMDGPTAARALDPFYTSRQSRKVGLGLPFFKMAAELTGGSLSLHSAPGAGTVVTAGFGLTHIDRAPLGDMAGTFMALLTARPDLDVVYTPRTPQGEFCADTRQFRALLEGVPLNDGAVLAFAGEYIREHLAAIHSAA